MKDSQYWFAGTAAVTTLLVAWFAGRWLRLSGADLWVMRLGVASLGFSVIGALLWPRIRAASSGEAKAGSSKPTDKRAADAGSSGDIASLIHEAQSAAGHRLANLPVVLVLEPTASTGGLIQNCGLDAEPLASIAGGKISITRGTIFLELKPQIYEDSKAWGHVIRSLSSRRVRSLFPGATQPARTVVLSLPCLDFGPTAKAESATTRVQDLRSRLREVSRLLGIKLPVYVVFTALEEVPYFKEYAARLTSEVLADPFGVTLPGEVAGAGVWADQQSKRIARGFRQLFELLSVRRLPILAESDSHEYRRKAYLFPREFRKLTRLGPIADFLLEVSRPHQLGLQPYLRGFYFTATRESGTSRPVEELTTTTSPQGPEDFNLTRVLTGSSFVIPGVRQAAPKSLEWLFLQRLFASVILPDLNNLGGTFVSRHASFGRRVLVGAFVGLLLFVAAEFTVSYVGNRRLQSRAVQLSNALRVNAATPDQPIPYEQLDRLESLRQMLAKLRSYRDGGPPWALGWGLYTGNELYPQVRTSYFDRFERIMLAPVQASLRNHLSSLRAATPGANDFESAYEPLKAYLITRSHPDKSTREFLSPVLLKWWQTRQGTDPERRRLAQLQFDFYSEELQKDPPYPRHGPDNAIAEGRRYLQDNFGGMDRIYGLMTASASRENATVSFRRLFPGTEDLIVNTPEIPGAFTKGGWAAMQKMLHNPGRWSAEDWVVTMPQVDISKLSTGLPARYTAEYVKRWSEFIQHTRVIACRTRSAADAGKRLTLLSEPQSPLLGLFCVAAQNTDVDSLEIKSIFQPVRTLVSPECARQYTNNTNGEYVNALFSLKERLQDASIGSQGADARAAVAPQVAAARTAAHNLETKFQVEPQWQINKAVGRLLNEPIAGAEACIPGVEIGPVCAQFRGIRSKYPFDARSSAQASVAEVDAFFNPKTGLLWDFQQQALKNLVIQQGSRYVQSPLAARSVRSEFLTFLNRSARLRDALYKGGAGPHMAFSIKVTPSPGIASVKIRLGDKTQTYSGSYSEAKEFAWDAGTQGAELDLLGGEISPPGLKFEGPWALFRLIDEMRVVSQTDTQASLEWTIRERRSNEAFRDRNGNPLKLRLDITGDGISIFRAESRAGLQCVSTVTH